MKKIKGILITPNQKGTMPRVYELEYNSYKDFYPILECDMFDIQTRKFNDTYLDIYCDDEGLYKEDNKISIVTQDNGSIVETIVGNVFICNHNNQGDSISLTEEEIKEVMSTIRVYLTLSNKTEDSIVCAVTI